MTRKERLELILGNLNARTSQNAGSVEMSEEALIELSEIIGTQDEAIFEIGELLSELLTGGEQ